MIFVSAPLFLEKIATTERNPKCELYLVASRDGKSFDAPILVNEVKEMAAEALHSMAVAPDGTVHVVWLDAREGKGNCLFYARHAGGKFTKNVRLTNAVCPCCAPGMAIDGRGNQWSTARWRTTRAADLRDHLARPRQNRSPPAPSIRGLAHSH